MGSVKEYFSSLGSGVASLLKGLQVTGKELVTPKITEFYPEDRATYKWPERFRAILQLVYDDEGRHRCIACGTCERVCPNGTIKLETKMVETPEGRKKKKLDKYFYDLGSCTFCDLCVTNCPTNALAFSNDFEQSVFTRDKLLKKLNYLPEKEDPAPSPEESAKAKSPTQAPASSSADDKAKAATLMVYNKAKAALDSAADEAKAEAQAMLDKIIAVMKAKGIEIPGEKVPAATPAVDKVKTATLKAYHAAKTVLDSATDETKAEAQAKLDKIIAVMKAKGIEIPE